MWSLSSISRMISVAILTMGVFMGVFLVGQRQDIRRRAAELKEHKVTICHKTGSEENPWVQIEVSKKALDTHLAHGDIQGNCPSGGDDEDGDKDDKKGDDGDQAPQVAVGGITLANNVTVNNETINPAEVETIVETKYVYVTTRFDFWIKFQEIDEKREDKIVRVIFRKGDEELHVYNKVGVTSDLKGIYRGTITDVKPGMYEILIKGDGFLQKKHENINLLRGGNRYYWSEDELLAGDFNSDNILDAKDLAEFFSFYTEDLNPINEENKVFDIDMNGFIDLGDIKPVFENYTQLVTEGDN